VSTFLIFKQADWCKAEATTFFKNGFDYDAQGLIYSGDFISPDHRGNDPIITNSTYNFTDGGFSYLYGYLKTDDSTSTSPYNSAKPWAFLNEVGDYVYSFLGHSATWEFRVYYDSEHPANYSKPITAGVNIFSGFTWGAPLPITLELDFYNSQHSQVLAVKKVYESYAAACWGGYQTFDTTAHYEISFFGYQYDNFDIVGDSFLAHENLYERYCEYGIWPRFFNDKNLKVAFYPTYFVLQGYGTIDLPQEFINDIAFASFTFQLRDTDAIENDLSGIAFDDLYVSGDINLLPPVGGVPTPTPTPTPEPTSPPEYEPNCAPPAGNILTDTIGNIKYAICLSLNFLFYPTDTQQQTLASNLNSVKNVIQTKPPFGYFALIKNKFDNLNASATSSDYFVDFDFYDVNDIIKNGLTAVLWLMATLYILKRLKVI